MKFYTEILGMTLIRKYQHMALLRCGSDDRITILGKTDAIHPDNGKQTVVHHAFSVESDKYSAALDFVQAQGIEVILEQDRPSAATIAGPRFYIHDPDRNVIEVIDWANPGEL